MTYLTSLNTEVKEINRGIPLYRIYNVLDTNFPDKNTGAGCYFLLQGIFLIQGLNPRFLHWQANSLPLSDLGSQPLYSIYNIKIARRNINNLRYSDDTTLLAESEELLDEGE